MQKNARHQYYLKNQIKQGATELQDNCFIPH